MIKYEKNHCIICGSDGKLLYEKMNDRLFGSTENSSLYKCSRHQCGLIWQNPTPHEDDLGRLYENYYTHSQSIDYVPKGLVKQLYNSIKLRLVAMELGYSKSNYNILFLYILNTFFKILFTRKLNEALFEYMFVNEKYGETLLEVGFGNAEVMDRLKSKGFRVFGIEFDEVSVIKAQKRFVDVERSTLTTTSYNKHRFDCIIMSHVIEHLYDPKINLSSCYDMLKSGGKLIIVTPNSASFGHKVFSKSWMHLDQPRHLHIFNLDNLIHLAKDTGFSITASKTMTRDIVNLFGSSWKFFNNKSHVMGGKFRIREILVAQVLGLFAGLYLKFVPDSGEEIVLVLEKP